MDRIGIRELRQHASRYLDRVKAGESIEVTDRGRPVALLVPHHEDRWQDLIASGEVVAATASDHVLDELPGDYGIAASRQLEVIRADEH